MLDKLIIQVLEKTKFSDCLQSAFCCDFLLLPAVLSSPLPFPDLEKSLVVTSL